VMPADRAAALRAERLEPPFERLKALHTPKRPPRPGDWLAEHHEDGQSFAEFARSLPLVPTAARRTSPRRRALAELPVENLRAWPPAIFCGRPDLFG